MVTTRRGTRVSPYSAPLRTPAKATAGYITPDRPSFEPLSPQQTYEDAARAVALHLHFPVLIDDLREAASAEDGTEQLKILLVARPCAERQLLQKFLWELCQCCGDHDANSQDDVQAPVTLPAEVNNTTVEISQMVPGFIPRPQLATAGAAFQVIKSPKAEFNISTPSKTSVACQQTVIASHIEPSPLEHSTASSDDGDEGVETVPGLHLELHLSTTPTSDRSQSPTRTHAEEPSDVDEVVGSLASPSLPQDHSFDFRWVPDDTLSRTSEPSVELQKEDSVGMNLSNLDFSPPTVVDEERHTTERSQGSSTTKLQEFDNSHIDEASDDTFSDDHEPAGTRDEEATKLLDSPKRPSFRGLMTPQDTPLKVQSGVLESDYQLREEINHPPILSLAQQSVPEFAEESLQKVEQFRLLEEVSTTYQETYNALKEPEGRIWSDGSQWKHLLDSGIEGRQRSTLCYALTSIEFARWHRNQALLLGLSPKMAAQKVSRRVLQAVVGNRSGAQDQDRRNLNTHLTRGRKWTRLVDELGFGILFLDAWSLAKASGASLDNLTSHVKTSEDKLFILECLAEQMEVLMKKGQTTPDLFRHHLQTRGWISALPTYSPLAAVAKEVSSLRHQMTESAPNGKIRTIHSTFTFDIESLSRLESTHWFDDQLVLLCLHLAQKRSYVRVGFSVPLHRETEPTIIRSKPFEMAARKIKDWNVAEEASRLVCFFPLFLQGNHFSLLEINQREGSIYHYDSSEGGYLAEIKGACKDQFPSLQFTAQRTQSQLDSHSCGPLVVSFARHRMMNRRIPTGTVQAEASQQLRFDALVLVRDAWRSGVLIRAEEPLSLKRGKRGDDEGRRKRTKLRDGIQVHEVPI